MVQTPVQTNSMLAEGGHNYRAFLAGAQREEKGSEYEMVAAALARRGSAVTPPPGRIQALKTR